MQKIKKFAVLVVGIASVLSLLVYLPAQAAGSAHITVENAGSVSAGGTVELRFYVTATGANIGGLSFNVNLVNLAYLSYDSTGTNFNGFSGVPSGGSAGSVSFEIAASYLGGGGGSGKVYVGKVTSQASGTAGTGQINISNVQAVDTTTPDAEAMSTTSQDGSITINAAPAATCAAGQTGSPPNCVTPPVASGTNPVNPTTQPNQASIVSVPRANTTATTPALAVSEQALSDNFVSEGAIPVIAEDDKKSETKKSSLKGLLIAGVSMLILGLGGLTVFIRKRRLKFYNKFPPKDTKPPSPPDSPTPPNIVYPQS